MLLVAMLGCADSEAESLQGALAPGDTAEVALVDSPEADSGERPGEEPGERSDGDDEEEPTTATSIQLALAGEGLRVFLIPSGSSRPVNFGMPKTSALEILTAVRQRPPREQGENVECQLSYATWGDGLTTWFSRDQFTGWSLPTGRASLSTASGVGIGSTRTELESAYDADVGASTFGVEFSAGGFAGLLESEDPDARITNLWAGTACLAR
ncbi:hypothetical protein BH23GEM6_BH23GEM6_03380 [soil metagenome]